MSAVKMQAVTLWTQLVNAMRQDEMIAHAIVQSGPATTAVLMEAAALMLGPAARNSEYPWLSCDIHPESGRHVLCQLPDESYTVGWWDVNASAWMRKAIFDPWSAPSQSEEVAMSVLKWRYFDGPEKQQ